MHRCLHVPEIVHNIAEKAGEAFEEMGPMSASYTGYDSDSAVSNASHRADAGVARTVKRNPVLALALCCKAFHREAIRVIWRSLGSILPLLRCFPRDVWHPNSPDYQTHVRPSQSALRSLA